MSYSVKIVDNSKEVLDALERAKQAALKAVGATAERYAKGGCPVQSGRLRASITFATAQYHSSPGDKAEAGDADLKGSPEEDAVYIGTNVEYAPYVETDDSKYHKTGGAHFLRNAAASHSEEYKMLVEQIMENA